MAAVARENTLMASGAGSDRIVFAHLPRGLAALSVVVSHFGVMIWSKPAIVAGLIYLQARLEDEKQCILVLIGATPEGSVGV